jgi:TatD DNase family protein
MTLGIHPYHASDLYDGTSSLNEMRDFAQSLRESDQMALVAFGEVGLDYFRLERAGKDIQQKAFVDQLELATTLRLPLFLHARNACDDFIALIEPFLPRLSNRGVVHSFAGSKAEMLRLIDLGFDISVNGVSFGSEDQLEMVKAIPLERLQLETDAPWCEIDPNGPAKEYLKDAPAMSPSRKPAKFVKGEMVKGRNESCTIVRVAYVVAGVKGLSVAEVVEAAWQNSVRMFGLGDNRHQHEHS